MSPFEIHIVGYIKPISYTTVLILNSLNHGRMFIDLEIQSSELNFLFRAADNGVLLGIFYFKIYD